MNGIVKEILITHKAGAPLYKVQKASLIAGKGIEGDRYYNCEGTFSEKLQESKDYELTLIEQEEIDIFNKVSGLHYSNDVFRRNIVTTGIKLNSLIGKEFYMGNIKLKAIRLCEPCAYLAGLLGNEIMQHMIHKAGIRTIIISGGNTEIGNTIRY